MTSILLTQLILLVLVAYSLHKIRKVHIDSYLNTSRLAIISDEVRALYPQVQSYMDLNKLLDLQHPLPLLRGWAASPDFLLTIARHSLEEKPLRLAEFGSGSSTIVLARTLQLNGQGHLYSVEHDSAYGDKTRLELEKHNLSEWVTIVNAPITELSLENEWSGKWYSVEVLEQELPRSIDMLVIDGPPQSTCELARYPSLPVTRPYQSEACCMFLDDAARPEEQEILEQWRKRYPVYEQTNLGHEKGCYSLGQNR